MESMVGNMKKLQTVTSMSVTKYAGDDYSMQHTVCWWRFQSFRSPTSTIFLHMRRAQHSKDVSNIEFQSPTTTHRQQL